MTKECLFSYENHDIKVTAFIPTIIAGLFMQACNLARIFYKYLILTFHRRCRIFRNTRFRHVQGWIKVGKAFVTGEGETTKAEVSVEGIRGVVDPL